MEELKSKEEASKILDKIKQDNDLANVEEMIKSNVIEFKHNDKTFRVRLMSLKEKQELNDLRLKKFGQLIQDKDILLEKDLIKLYKERGIDVDKLDEELRKIESEIYSTQIKLGEAISKNESESILKAFKENIITLLEAKNTIIIQKTNLLQLTLENQLLGYVAEYITYLTIDILEGEKWERVFKTYEEFINCKDEQLLNKAGYRSMLLQEI